MTLIDAKRLFAMLELAALRARDGFQATTPERRVCDAMAVEFRVLLKQYEEQEKRL